MSLFRRKKFDPTEYLSRDHELESLRAELARVHLFYRGWGGAALLIGGAIGSLVTYLLHS